MDRNKSFSITRYAFQSFRHYGGKSIIFMIILSVTLVLGLLNIMTSLQKTFIEQSIGTGGDAHFAYNDINPEQIELLKSQKEIEWVIKTVFVSGMRANVTEMNGIGFGYIENLNTMEGFKLASGKFPEKQNEVAIAPHTAEYLGIEAKPGAEFELEMTNNDYSVFPAESFKTTVKFTVSGVLERQYSYEVSDTHFLFVSKKFIEVNNQNDNSEVFAKLKKGYDAYITAPILADLIGVDENNISYNYNYLNATLNGAYNQIVFSIIIAFFMLVGAIIIYNAFNIVIAKRARHFGLLTLIGASKKQIIQCVYIEGAINTISALPIGVFLGTFLSRLVVPLVQTMIGSRFFTYHAEPYSYLLTILIAAAMVAAGAIIPAKRAGKITPVEAAKFSPNSVKTNKKSKKIRIIKNITLPSLARINLFRKKGAGGIVISLSIVGMLFIFLSFMLFSVFYSVSSLIRDSMATDIQIMQGSQSGNDIVSNSGEKPILPKEVVERIINLDGVTKSHGFYSRTYRDIEDYNTDYVMQSYIIGVDEEFMLELLNKLYLTEPQVQKLGLSDFENSANVIAAQYFTDDGIVIGNYHSGDDITVNLQTINDTEPTGQATLHIAGILNRWDLPQYLDFGRSDGLSILFMLQSTLEANPELNTNINGYGLSFNIDSSKYKSIAASLDKICEEEGNIYYKSFVNLRKEAENQFMSVMALIFAGLGIVFSVSLLNLISTTFIGVEQRKKELGVLSALGLGQKELKKMMKWEGIWISAFSSVISIAGGFGLGYLFSLWIESMGGDYIKLSVPILPIIIFCLIYVFVPYIISSIAVRRLLKNTMVELIGQEI